MFKSHSYIFSYKLSKYPHQLFCLTTEVSYGLEETFYVLIVIKLAPWNELKAFWSVYASIFMLSNSSVLPKHMCVLDLVSYLERLILHFLLRLLPSFFSFLFFYLFFLPPSPTTFLPSFPSVSDLLSIHFGIGFKFLPFLSGCSVFSASFVNHLSPTHFNAALISHYIPKCIWSTCMCLLWL